MEMRVVRRNAQRSHAGPMMPDARRDELPALAGATGSAFHLYSYSCDLVLMKSATHAAIWATSHPSPSSIRFEIIVSTLTCKVVSLYLSVGSVPYSSVTSHHARPSTVAASASPSTIPRDCSSHVFSLGMILASTIF